MKRQFVHIQPSQNKGEGLVRQNQQRQGGLLSRAEWSPTTDAQPGVTSAADPKPAPASYTPGVGLLSGWKAMRGSGNPSSINSFNRTSDGVLIEREAMRPQGRNGSVTGPAIHLNSPPSQTLSAQPFDYRPAQTDSLSWETQAGYAGSGYGSGTAPGAGYSASPYQRGGLISYADQSALAQMPVAQNMPVGVAMGVVPTMSAVAPVAPPAPVPQQVDPFGLPVIAPQQDGWSQGWGGGPQGANIGYPPSPGYPGYQGYPGYAYPGYQSPPGGYVPPAAKKRNKRRVPIWARVILIFVLLILLTGGAGAYYYEVNFAAPVSHITGQQVARLKGDVNPNQASASGGDILSGGRINILLLGSDTDQKFDGVFLAQTDIVVTIDPQTKYVGMLSIPRDTWLQTADGMMKLDQAYGRGGIALSRATIYEDFGIPINYYAWVGLDGFIKVVDTVNGVDIDAIHPITDDAYPNDTSGSKDIYGYERLYIAPGPQHMNGQTALEYVRSRHADLVGDFGRSQRQQQLLSALKLKLNNPNVVGELPQIANDLNGYVKTDMQLTDVFKLMNFARTIGQGQIKQVVLDGNYSRTVSNYPTPPYGTQDIVVLNCANVQPVIAQMFGLGDQAQCNTGISSTGTPTSTTVATVTQPSPAVSPAFATPISSDSTWQVAQQMSAINGLSYSDGSSSLLGMRSLLDLLCLATFESPIGMQV